MVLALSSLSVFDLPANSKDRPIMKPDACGVSTGLPAKTESNVDYPLRAKFRARLC